MNLIDAFVNSPVKVTVGVLLVVMFGILSLFHMPVQLAPEVETPTLTIDTTWPGASPQEIEREIVQEQEEQLKGVEGVIKMSSECMDSRGRIVLEFNIGTNMAEALLKVNTRLQQVRSYPIDADEPSISTANSNDRPVAYIVLSDRGLPEEDLIAFRDQHPELKSVLDKVLTARTAGLRSMRLREAAREHPEIAAILPPPSDVYKMRRFAEDTIEARFERVAGVSNSEVSGGREEEVQVIVDPQQLAARQLTLSDLRQALRLRNRDTSGGDFWVGKRRYLVRTLGQFDSVGDVENMLISKRDGKPVYVRDVATVEMGFKKPTGVVRRFGQEVLSISGQREGGANVLQVMEGIRATIEDLNESVLHDMGLQLTQVYDETEYIHAALHLVNENIIVGGILTVIILLIFLRSMRSTLIIGLAIPVSIIGTFLFMALLGRSLNVISLAGLAFAVGKLADDAIVVLENIYRHYQMGKSPYRAAVSGTQEVWGAVLASTLTSMAVFLPVLFVKQEAGQLFRDIAIAMSAAVGLSLIVSVTVVPMAAARILKSFPGEADLHNPGAQRKTAVRRRGLGALWHSLYSPVANWTDRMGNRFVEACVGLNAWIQKGLARQLIAIAGLVIPSLLLSWMLIPKVEYLPTGNRNQVSAILLPPPGYNMDIMGEIGAKIEQDLKPYWNVNTDDPEAMAALDYPAIGDFFYTTRAQQLFVNVRALDPMRAKELVPLLRKVGAKQEGVISIAKQASLFERGISAGRTIDVEITGPEIERLIELGIQIRKEVLAAIPAAQALPKPSLDLSNPEYHVIPRWESAGDLHVSAEDLGFVVNALVDGAYAADYYKDGDKIDLTLMARAESVRDEEDLRNLPIVTPTGNTVPLSSLADVDIKSGPQQINRRERERAITISVTPPETMPLQQAMEIIVDDIIEPLEVSAALKGGYRVGLSGTTDRLLATWEALNANFILALLITYLLMAALFESWLYPLVVIFSVPLGAVGGLVGLWVVNFFTYQPLDVLTMLGFIILIGTVVNNAILVVHQALNHMREEQMPVAEAILESTRSRIRPIFMTTGTTVFGLIPLVVFPGAGSELYRGLGAVLLGGLIISTIFTLVLIPTLFLMTMNAKAAIVRMFSSSPVKTANGAA